MAKVKIKPQVGYVPIVKTLISSTIDELFMICRVDKNRILVNSIRISTKGDLKWSLQRLLFPGRRFDLKKFTKSIIRENIRVYTVYKDTSNSPILLSRERILKIISKKSFTDDF